MGAADFPPVVPSSSSTTAITILGSSAGANPINQAWVLPEGFSAVPVFPATLTFLCLH